MRLELAIMPIIVYKAILFIFTVWFNQIYVPSFQSIWNCRGYNQWAKVVSRQYNWVHSRHFQAPFSYQIIELHNLG